MSLSPNNLRVAVVVAARDAEATIEPCVDSLLASALPDDEYEVIVVDNGSRDRTADTARSSGARVLCEPKRGASAARNCGVRQTDAPLVAFTDSDCVVDPQWLPEMVAAAESGEFAICGGRIEPLRPCSRVAEFGRLVHNHRAAITGDPPYAISMNWISPRSVFESVGGFDESVLRGQDAELAYRLASRGLAFRYVDEAVVYHRNRSTLAGLLMEGYLHGRASVAVHARHAEYLGSFGKQMTYGQRVARAARRFGSPAPWSESALWLLHDLGKICGQMRGQMRDEIAGEERP